MEAELPMFDELGEKEELLENLLIGNGFAIWFSENFSYKNLLDKCEGLEKEDNALFSSLKTSNFEMCLKTLSNSIIVNEIYGVQDNHQNSYDRIKNSLIETVRAVHIESSQIGTLYKEASQSIFQKSQNIFTTNYDLLTYWTVLSVNNLERDNQFGDCFYYDYEDGQKMSELYFSETFATKKKRKIYYLHGALHLYEEDGVVKKLSASGDMLLDKMESNIKNGLPPLFVSEGDWELKKKAIDSNPYLQHCYVRLIKTQGTLTIFGHSLDQHSDQHIVRAIKKSEIAKIVYGVYSNGRSDADINYKKARINKIFEGKEVVFFNSDSFFEVEHDPWFGIIRRSR
ncbi:DUF4917 family protein [Paenibacillus yanchengensis]|uniref:DUF4917 family protein n=1 Tax=Paenibacillus yanchengensis TaxID=2035833 RepID=A0ABW4YP61_9BACL